MHVDAEGMLPDGQKRGRLKPLEDAPADKFQHALDLFVRDARQLNVHSGLRFFNQRVKDGIQHIIGGQGILIGLPRRSSADGALSKMFWGITSLPSRSLNQRAR